MKMLFGLSDSVDRVVNFYRSDVRTHQGPAIALTTFRRACP
jgi:hypothetical protein